MYADGTTESVVTDGSWATTRSPIAENDIVIVQQPRLPDLGHRRTLLVGQFLDALVGLLAAVLVVAVAVPLDFFPAGGRLQFLARSREVPPARGLIRCQATRSQGNIK